MARARIPQLRLVGVDPLSIERHFLFMTGAIHPFLPSIPLISGVDIALWDLAGKLLGQPITKLLGGTRPPILTGEKLEMVKQFKPFIDSQARTGGRRFRKPSGCWRLRHTEGSCQSLDFERNLARVEP